MNIYLYISILYFFITYIYIHFTFEVVDAFRNWKEKQLLYFFISYLSIQSINMDSFSAAEAGTPKSRC